MTATGARGRADGERRLYELGGLADDDSLRAFRVAAGMHGLAQLLASAAQLGAVGPGEIAALAGMLADDAQRVAERQLLDQARAA